jgi:hypothetical protein
VTGASDLKPARASGGSGGGADIVCPAYVVLLGRPFSIYSAIFCIRDFLSTCASCMCRRIFTHLSHGCCVCFSRRARFGFFLCIAAFGCGVCGEGVGGGFLSK